MAVEALRFPARAAARAPARCATVRGPPHQQPQLIRTAERLADVVVRAELHGLNGGSHGAERGDHDDGRFWRVLPEPAQHVEALAIGQLQIREYQMKVFACTEVEGFPDGCSGLHLVSLGGQEWFRTGGESRNRRQRRVWFPSAGSSFKCGKMSSARLPRGAAACSSRRPPSASTSFLDSPAASRPFLMRFSSARRTGGDRLENESAPRRRSRPNRPSAGFRGRRAARERRAPTHSQDGIRPGTHTLQLFRSF